MGSWLEIDPASDFSLANIPFGIVSTPQDDSPHVAVAIGNHVLDLKVLAAHVGLKELFPVLQGYSDIFAQPTLNEFASLGRHIHRSVRAAIQALLKVDTTNPELLRDNPVRPQALIPQKDVKMHLPMAIGDYTDFYAGFHHAHHVGVMFRGPQQPLQPNYLHLPVGYHGRASSVVVSGTPVCRPHGQILLDPLKEPKQPTLSPSKRLDFELELGCFIATPNTMGEPIPIDEADRHIFGYVLLNDWSARDIQFWEYVPLGPFNGKNFATSISPWVVLADALGPFKAKGLPNPTPVQDYLNEKVEHSMFAINLEVDLMTNESSNTIAKTSSKNLLWSFPQMIAHHTVGGCGLRTGDLLGSGTISGPGGRQGGQCGSLLEMTEGGKHELSLHGAQTRKFLEDGDTVILRGFAEKAGVRVGFGECYGRVSSLSIGTSNWMAAAGISQLEL